MYIRRLISAILSLLLVFSLPLSALAAEYDLSNGDIGINADDSGQTVTQNNTSTPDSAPVITSSTETSNTITVTTSGDATAEFTIKDVEISSEGPAIDIGDSSAVIHVEGDNSVSNTSENEAAIHVSTGDVTITSDSGGSLEVQSGLDGAGIGSDAHEEMSGDITISGDVEVTVSSGWDGAGIGSGYKGEMSGTIVIDESAQVSATAGTISNSGAAGVGSGREGNMSGDIGIFQDAQVEAESTYGAGIGSGIDAVANGNIIIADNAEVTATSTASGAGIGTGERSDMNGFIAIDGNATVTANGGSGAGIGSGLWSDMNGDVFIGGNADVTAMNGQYDPDSGTGNGGGSGIGSGLESDMSGSIAIVENATVTAGSVYGGTGIGSGNAGEMSGTIYIGGDAQVTAIGEWTGSGIGSAAAGEMSGSIVIAENAEVTAVTGSHSAAIGANNPEDMTGLIAIVDNANVTTGVHQEDEFYTAAIDVDPDTGDVSYQLNEDAIGYIGGMPSSPDELHSVDSGYYVLGTGATINGLTWEDADKLADYASVYLDENGQPTNVFLYESDTASDDDADEVVKNALLYWVVDEQDADMTYTTKLEDGILTVTSDQDYAVLTGPIWGAKILMNLGVKEVCFESKSATSTFALEDLVDQGKSQDTYRLTHDASTVTFVVGEKDIAEILK